MVAVTAPFYCQLCRGFYSGISQAQGHLLSVDHNEKYKVCLVGICVHCTLYLIVGFTKLIIVNINVTSINIARVLSLLPVDRLSSLKGSSMMLIF